MKRSVTSLVVAALLGAVPLLAQSKAKATNVPEIPFESVANFFKLPPDQYFGEGIGVATNSKGHVFVYTRSGDTKILEFDQNGNYVREIGHNLYGLEFAHTIRVDAQDNIWAVDEGTNMIIKFNPQGRVAMVLGRRPETAGGAFETSLPPAPPKKYNFGRQTDVGWDPQGNIFVSDGYLNSRVVKYDKNGRYITEVGGARGSAVGQLSTPHSIAVDANGIVYVGDRGNARVQVFDNDLKPKAIYDNVGNPWAVCVSPGQHQYLYVSNSYPDSSPAAARDITGEVYKMELDGTIIGKFGRAGKALGEFSSIHEIDCRNPNELFVSEISSWRVQKLIFRPQAPTTASGARQ
jgi:DNA-binding beta-propeller fold protein YncE